MSRLGTQLRAFRAARGWTQSDLARALGTDPVTVSRWERGVVVPRPGSARRLAGLGFSRSPKGRVSFVDDPASRIRQLDRVLAEQAALKRRARRVE